MTQSPNRPTATPFPRSSRLREALRSYRVAIAIAFAAGVIGSLVSSSPALGLGLALAIGLVPLAMLQPALGAVAVAFLLWANVPVVAVRSHGVPMPFAASYVLLLLLPAAWHMLVERRRFSVTSGLPWALLWLGVSILSAANSRDPERSFESVVELALEGVVVYVLATQAIRDRTTLRWVTWALLASGAFMGSICAIQQATGRFDVDFAGFGLVDSFLGGAGGAAGQARLAGPIGEMNRFGQFMLCLVALGIPAARATSRMGLKRALLVATALSAIGAALTFSRGNAVAFAGLVLCMLALGTVTRRQVLTLVAIGAFALVSLPQYRQRLATIPSALLLLQEDTGGEKPDGAIMGRTTQMIAAGLVYLDHPLLGCGPGLFPTYVQEYGNPLGLRRLKEERQAHSLIPHIAAEFGTLGLFAFLAMLCVTLRDLIRRARASSEGEDRELANAYVLALLAYFLSGAFLHLSYLRYYMFLIGIASACAALPLASRSGTAHATRAEQR